MSVMAEPPAIVWYSGDAWRNESVSAGRPAGAPGALYRSIADALRRLATTITRVNSNVQERVRASSDLSKRGDKKGRSRRDR